MIKSKELTILVFSIVVASVFGMVASNLIFKKGTSTRVEVVQPIVADFDFVDKPYFNEKSINPTLDIAIEESDNDDFLGQ